MTHIPHPSRGDRRQLLVLIRAAEPAMPGRRFALDLSRLSVGREQGNHVVLDDDSVSRRHAHWERRDDGWWIVDDGSTNGTYVNGEPLAHPRALVAGDKVMIGQAIFKYLDGEDSEVQYHEEIYRLWMVDGLTGLFSRPYLREEMERLLARGDTATALCVAMVDIDHFKRINDQLGLLVGDSILKELAGLLTPDLPGARCARWGGEEFALLLPGTSPPEAVVQCESVRARVAAHRFVSGGGHVRLTVSAGVAAARRGDGAADVLARAEERLALAKSAGRDRVCG